jgi:hypothetical protein
MSGMFVLLPQRFRFHVLELVGQPCMDVVALFIKRSESLFRGGMVRTKEAVAGYAQIGVQYAAVAVHADVIEEVVVAMCEDDGLQQHMHLLNL